MHEESEKSGERTIRAFLKRAVDPETGEKLTDDEITANSTLLLSRLRDRH
jgi:hypothetical protein